MKKMLFHRNVRIAAVLACAIAAVKGIKAFSPDDFNPQPDPPGFGLIAVTPASQYVRLNVTNLGQPDLNMGASCQVELTFGDGQGNTLKRGTETTLAPGKSTSLELMETDTTTVNGVLAPSFRMETLPAVQVAGSCSLLSSVELVNTATGQTAAFAMPVSAYVTHASGGINHNETLVRDSESR